MDTIIKKQLETLADNIRAQRLIKNYSQDYLALKLEISQNAYSKIELGYTRITVERLLVIAHVLEVSLWELFELAKYEAGNIRKQYGFGL
jgi:transcriptional regulator with XRE-family HTH domain